MLSNPQSERGAVLVHVALGLVALLGFSALSIDYGVMWTSRAQAQNAADAGALAGVTSLAFGDPDEKFADAKASAKATAERNAVWGEAPGVVVTTPTQPCPGDASGNSCIRADTFRNGSNGSNFLPTFFAQVINVQSQGVRAMAIAQVKAANAGDCLRPFAIPDLYQEVSGDPEVFDVGQDSYSPPGYTLANDYGTELVLRDGAKYDPDHVAPGWFRLLDLMGGTGGGTSDLNEMIRSCSSDVYGIGDDLTDHLKTGASGGLKHGVDDLRALDPSATWDGNSIEHSCVEDGSCMKWVGDSMVPDPGRVISPRVIPLVIFDPQKFATNGTVEIVNILGFFALDANEGKKEVRGVIVTHPGVFDPGNGAVDPGSAFILRTSLIR